MNKRTLPPLSRELLDQIVFGMENQEVDMFLDAASGKVVSGPEASGDLLPLPKWTPSDGFNLMESFTDSVRNPPCRKELRAALDSGRGVFRKFKEALAAYPPVREQWHRYKEQQLRAKASAWYERECGAAELSDIEELYDETETLDLTLSDLGISESPLDPESARALIRASLEENLGETRELAGLLLARYGIAETGAARSLAGGPVVAGDALKTGLSSGSAAPEILLRLEYMAKGPEGQQAGLVSGYLCRIAGNGTGSVGRQHPGGLTAVCQILYVEEAWRGLGLGSALLERFVSEAGKRGAARILLELAGNALELDQTLTKRGFRPVSALYSLDVTTQH